MANITELSSSELFVEMTEAQKDDIYRMVWFTHVCKDIESLMEDRNMDFDEDTKDSLIEDVANDYVYNGNYDCNFSYWDNLSSLIEKFLSL